MTSTALPALVLVVAVAALLFTASRQARTHDLAAVEVRDDAVVVRPRGALAVVALTRVLTIPLTKVVSADLVPGDDAHELATRKLAGGRFGGVTAGTFDSAGGRVFLLTSGAPTALRLVLRDHLYALVVVDTPQAADLARRVRAART